MPKHKSSSQHDSCSSEEEWEEVEESQQPNTSIHGNKDVEIELPSQLKKQQSKKEEKIREYLLMYIKRAVNKTKKNLQISMHKAHLLCLLGIGFRVNHLCSDDELQGFILSILPTPFIKYLSYNLTKAKLSSLMKWTNDNFTSENIKSVSNSGLQEAHLNQNNVRNMIEKLSIHHRIDLVVILLLIFRSLGFSSRLVTSLQPISLKPLTEKQKQEKMRVARLALQNVEKSLPPDNEKRGSIKSRTAVEDMIPQLDGANDEIAPKVPRRSTRTKKNAPKTASEKLNKTVKNKTGKSGKENLDLSKGSDLKRKAVVDLDVNQKTLKVTKTIHPEVSSKYDFSGDENAFVSGESVPTSKKLSKMIETSKRPSLKRKSANSRSKPVACERSSLTLSANTKTSEAIEVKEPTKASKKNSNQTSKKNSSKISKTKNKSKQRIVFTSTEDSNEDSIPQKSRGLEKKEKTSNYSDSEKCNMKMSNQKKTVLRKRAKKINYIIDKEQSDESDNGSKKAHCSDDDFVEESPTLKSTKKRSSLLPPPKPANRKRSLSRNSINKNGCTNKAINQWIEVYIRSVGWVCVDCISGIVDEPKQIEANASKPVHYVVTFDNENFVKDVTARYASEWLIKTRKLRVGTVDQNWWKNTLQPYKTKNQKRDTEENKQMEDNLLSQPLPSTISAFKDHPLFALRRHLLKYEAIYPPDVPAIGFIRGEEVLPRSSVHTMHTREKWLQEALSVKDGEEPYKMVASYLLNKKLNRDSDALSLALFGRWQTEPYKPPVASNGKVPRNEYGNVDLFRPCMMPVGCVQLRLPNLQVTAKKLNIDIATAVIGFDTHNGFPHPVTDGFVACEEFQEVLEAAWEEDQTHAAKRAQEKVDKRVYSRWKVLIRGLLALKRVREKYNDETNSKALRGSSWQTAQLQAAKVEKNPKRGRRSKKKIDENFPFEVETL